MTYKQVRTPNLVQTAVTAGTYTSQDGSISITVDGFGRITSITSVVPTPVPLPPAEVLTPGPANSMIETNSALEVGWFVPSADVSLLNDQLYVNTLTGLNVRTISTNDNALITDQIILLQAGAATPANDITLTLPRLNTLTRPVLYLVKNASPFSNRGIVYVDAFDGFEGYYTPYNLGPALNNSGVNADGQSVMFYSDLVNGYWQPLCHSGWANTSSSGLIPPLSGVATDVLLGTGAFGPVPASGGVDSTIAARVFARC